MNSTTPLRLAYLVSQYPTISHTFILREIRKLRALGCDIQVVSVRAPDRTVTQLTPDEREEYQRTLVIFEAGMAAIVGAHLKTMLRRPGSYFAGLLYAIRLAKWDLREIFLNVMYFGEAVVAGSWMWTRGLMHVHSHFSSTLELFVARVFPITYSATIHGSGEFDDVVGFYMAEKVARAAFLIGISQYGRSQMMRASDPQHWHKLEVVPLGVDPNVFLPRAHRENPERFEIVCVGSLVPAKGYHILLAAFARLIQQGRTSWRLRLVGEGRARPSLENAIRELGLENHVRLEGACNQERVREIYRESDLFALTSFAEGVPVVLMEAMAMEIPCLATWITGVPELIRHGVDGWLVPPGDAEPVAEALGYLMDQPALRESMGKSGRARVIEKYNLEQNVAQLAEIFRRRLS
ncbi:MAG TPA: glycosyltransferase [Bryobacteraceae bacterium]|nr:glycosyltransferase [Bryobacteraceae bacterium]